jgi:RNA recognition motif-containing protein
MTCVDTYYLSREIEKMEQNKLYVGNFPYSVDEAQLRGIFSQYGEISQLALIMDRDTGRPKGFGFITFATQAAAEKALEQNGKDLGGRPLKVNIATDKPRTGGGGGGGGFRGGNGGGGGGGGGNRGRW